MSRATASRVLRGATNVSDSARDAVLSAVDELAYTVNRAARSLVTRRSDSLAFLVAEDEERMFHDPYFLAVLRGAQQEAASAGLQLVFAVAATAPERTQFERFVAGGHVDGVLLVSLHGDDTVALQLERLGVPTVLNGRPFAADTPLFSVDADNVSGARLATELLLERGACRVATITGPLDMSVGQDRLSGHVEALRHSGVQFCPERAVAGDFTAEGGVRAMRRLLEIDPDIDAVFAASDMMALGALQVLHEHGRHVPDDVAVVGFDDIRESQLSVPRLSTMRQPLGELGRTMTRVLIDRLAGLDVAPRTVLPTELIRRETA